MKICFTGKRPKELCGYDKSKYKLFVTQLEYILTNYVIKGYDTFISGGAQGFDQLAFWAVNIVKETAATVGTHSVQNIVYVPFKHQADKWLSTGLFSQHEYKLMLHHADEIRYITDINTTDFKQVVKALMLRNEAMINDADLVIALYPDDTWTTNNGGTAAAIRYAKKCGKPVLQLKYTTQPHLCITEVLEHKHP